MTSIPDNLYTWSNTSKQVNSYQVSLNIKDESRKPLDTSNFSRDAELYIPRNASNLAKYEDFYVKPFGDRKFIQYHQVDVNSVNYSVHIQLRPVNESLEKLTVLLRYNERPTLENFEYNWTIPDLRSCSYQNVSRLINSSLPGSASNITNSSGRNSSGIEQITVIDVERDCKRDPYTVSISNEVVTKSGKYYLGKCTFIKKYLFRVWVWGKLHDVKVHYTLQWNELTTESYFLFSSHSLRGTWARGRESNKLSKCWAQTKRYRCWTYSNRLQGISWENEEVMCYYTTTPTKTNHSFHTAVWNQTCKRRLPREPL